VLFPSPPTKSIKIKPKQTKTNPRYEKQREEQRVFEIRSCYKYDPILQGDGGKDREIAEEKRDECANNGSCRE